MGRARGSGSTVEPGAQTGPRAFDQTEVTRKALLDAGLEVHHQAGRGLLQGSLTSQAVSEAAGVHRQTFYRYWSTVGDYVDELVERTLDPTAVLGEGWDPADLGGSAPLSDVLRAGLQQSIDVLLSEPAHRLRLTLWSVHEDDDEVSERLRTLVREVEAHVAVTVQRVCEVWNREPLPPLDARQVGAIVWSLALGLALRADASGDASDTTLFPEAVMAILPGLTRRRGDDRDLSDHAALLDRSALRQVDHRPGFDHRSDATMPKVVLEAARQCIEEHGPSGAAPERVAERAGCTEAEVRSAVGSARQIVRSLVDELLEPLADAALVDRSEDTDALGMLRRQVHRLALVCGRNREVFAAALSLRLERAPLDQGDLLEDVLADLLLPLVQAAKEHELVRAEVAAVQAAELLSDLLVVRIVGAAAEPPARAASAVLDLWLRGTQTSKGVTAPA